MACFIGVLPYSVAVHEDKRILIGLDEQAGQGLAQHLDALFDLRLIGNIAGLEVSLIGFDGADGVVAAIVGLGGVEQEIDALDRS